MLAARRSAAPNCNQCIEIIGLEVQASHLVLNAAMRSGGQLRFRGHILCSAFSISPARSPTMTQGAMVLPVVTRGKMEPSTMRRFSIP